MRKAPARFNDEEIDTALVTLALCSGNSRRASAELQAVGIEVGQSTLHKWRTGLHCERYERLYKQQLPRISERVAQRCEELAETQAELAARLVHEIDQNMATLRLPREWGRLAGGVTGAQSGAHGTPGALNPALGAGWP